MNDDRFWVGPAESPDTYQLISQLGNGAEGQVWKAVVQLSESGRGYVAVKILPPNVSDEESTAWIRHSHLLKSLEHPGLVRVTDVFLGPRMHRDGTISVTDVDVTEPPVATPMHRYVVMKLVEGVTLREWLDESPDATVSARLRTLSTVGSALDEMHSGRQTGAPVAHGDVKPSNIVIRDDGSSVLVDLGLMRIADAQGRSGRTRPYAAPELFRPGAVATPEADRFAFAATAVHVITGEAPPTTGELGPDLEAVAGRFAENPISALRPLLAQRLLAALHSAPEDRPANLVDWLASLTDTLSQTTQPIAGDLRPPRPEPMHPPSRRPWRKAALIGGSLAVLVTTGLLAFALSKSVGKGTTAQTNPTSTADLSTTQTQTPAAETTASTEAPSANPSGAQTATGETQPAGAYDADWSAGASGWVGPTDWKTLNGKLLNDGTGEEINLRPILAPYEPGAIMDYAVEVDIRVIAEGGSFGIVVRADGEGGGYAAGIGSGWDRTSAIADLHGQWAMNVLDQRLVTGKVYHPQSAWHTYRVESNANTVRLLVDGAVLVALTDNRYLAGGQVGLWSNAYQLEIRRFEVVAT